jgi:hypothetical protein
LNSYVDRFLLGKLGEFIVIKLTCKYLYIGQGAGIHSLAPLFMINNVRWIGTSISQTSYKNIDERLSNFIYLE